MSGLDRPEKKSLSGHLEFPPLELHMKILNVVFICDELVADKRKRNTKEKNRNMKGKICE